MHWQHRWLPGRRRMDPATGCLSLLGAVLFLVGLLVLALALPRWVWIALFGAALAGLGWLLLSK